MKPQSAKAKGRRLVLECKDLLLGYAKSLTHNDIFLPATSQSGADLKLSEAALKIYPFAMEMKNTEKVNIWAAINQAKNHAKTTNLKPLVLFRRNHSEIYATLSFKDLLEILSKT